MPVILACATVDRTKAAWRSSAPSMSSRNLADPVRRSGSSIRLTDRPRIDPVIGAPGTTSNEDPPPFTAARVSDRRAAIGD